MLIESIAQNETNVKVERYKSKTVNLSEILALADISLAQARRFRAEYLRSGDGLAWRRWRACVADREALLAEVGR